MFELLSRKVSCMATKKISLELDATERSRSARMGQGSLSQVVRRARLQGQAFTGESILRDLEAVHSTPRLLPKAVLEYWGKVERADTKKPRISPSPWDRA